MPGYVHPNCDKCHPDVRGYLDAHADAERRMKAGEKQSYCRHCKRYRWLHEMKTR